MGLLILAGNTWYALMTPMTPHARFRLMEKLSYLLTAHHLGNLETPARKRKVARSACDTSLSARSSEKVLTP